MKRSSDRILTTHAGSLPRPSDIIQATKAGQADDARLRQAVGEVVAKQAEIGIDVVDDGEYSKPSFVTYVRDRLDGIGEIGGTRGALWGSSRDARAFPDFYSKMQPGVTGQPNYGTTGPIRYKGHALLKRDLDNLKAAMKQSGVTEAFVPSISIANIENWNANKYYASDEEYRTAICDAMHEEYKAIVDAGFILQIDDPRLVTYYIMQPDLSLAEVRRWAQMQVDALNYALRGIPREKIRYHTCYSINMAPRVHDMQAKDIVDIILKIRAGAFSFEASNPRHEHEWTVWRDARKPADTILIPGVVTHCSLLVEHEELVAERLIKFANFAGRDNIIAGTDCGFATFAGSDEIAPSIAWAKLEALVRGAEIASKRLRAGKKAKPAKAKRAVAKAKPRAKAAKKNAKKRR
jgi:5-methyltetrahydropteroyltriglutamate--homocysteine methyltransferase